MILGVFKEIIFFPFHYFLSLFFFFFPFKKKKKLPILFVPGYLNSKAVFIFHANRLKKDFSVYSLNMSNPFGSIESFAEKIKEKTEKIKKETGFKQIILIGHSMGALACLKYLNNHETKDKMIAIAAPLKGTKLASIGFGKCVKEMKIDSAFIKNLDHNPKYFIGIIRSSMDHMIFPSSSAFIENVQEICFKDVGHSSMLFSKKVTKYLKKWLYSLN